MIDQMVERVKGVLRLQTSAFEEIEQSRGATLQALLVVVVVAIAAAIGGIGDDGSDGILSAISGAVVGWVVFSALCYVIGTRFVASPQTQSSWGELLRVLGFAEAPNVLSLFAFIPFFGGLIAAIGSLWSLLAAILGIKAALEIPYPRAAIVAIVAWVVRLALQVLIALIFGVTALVFRMF
jgi:hypothetical protein